MAGSLAGKFAVVTGASAGIGRATVEALVAAGATVLATGRRQAALDALARQYGASVETLAGDITDADFVTRLAAHAGAADILVSNAGILKYAPLMDTTTAEVEAMFRTNVIASFEVIRAVVRPMIARQRGHVIVMSSIAAREVYRLGVIYAATKHALSAITRGLRLELQGVGIKVTEIAPGMVDTDIRAGSDHPKVLEAIRARKYAPLTPAEVAAAVVYAAQAPDNCCPDLIELRPRGAP